MNEGNKVYKIQAVTNGEWLDIQPENGVEWVIHNIHFAGKMRLFVTDGNNQIQIEQIDTPNSMLTGLMLHCTNSHYYRIYNNDTTSKNYGYDGMITRQTS